MSRARRQGEVIIILAEEPVCWRHSISASPGSSRGNHVESNMQSHDVPVPYPILIPLHLLPWQYPNTPKETPWNVASGMALMIGVEMVDKSSRTKAAKKRMDSGVAGRSIMVERLVGA